MSCNLAIIRVLPFLNNPKDLGPSYKMDLDSWDCFGRKKAPSYNRRNTVSHMKLGPPFKVSSKRREKRGIDLGTSGLVV